MPSPALQVVGYCALVALASLAGGWIPLVTRLTHNRTQLLMSFVAGLMLGVGGFHMLVHAASQTRSLDQAVAWMMVGLLTLFFLQRFFHFHQHGPGDLVPASLSMSDEVASVPCHLDHDHDHHHAGEGMGHQAPSLSWIGLAIGLLIHTLLDGVALAASVEVEASSGHTGSLFGLGTFLAVILHKPLDSMAIAVLMVAAGRPSRQRQAVNLLFALVVPLGVGLFYLGLEQMAADQQVIVGCALAFSAGTFLCIALSDLLPEIQFHTHDRVKLSAALLLGLAVAYAIGYLETSGHAHHATPAGHSTEHRH